MMVIRPVRPEDAPQVLGMISAILDQEFPGDKAAYAPEDLRDLMATYQGPMSTFLVAEEDGKIVGTCGVKADGPQTAILRRLFVDPHSRGKGVGSRLLSETLAFCRSRKFNEVVIRTSTTMEKAIRLCKAQGFEEDGRWNMGEVTLIRFHLRLT